MNRAFTLIELLVVIAIIALLIGILLPTLSTARETGQRLICASNQRQAAIGMSAYALDEDEYFPGANTSGYRLTQRIGGNQDEALAFIPGRESPAQNWDWASPTLADMLDFPDIVPEGDGLTDQLKAVAKKLDVIMYNERLECPSNEVRYKQKFSGGTLPTYRETGEHPKVFSYTSPSYFHLVTDRAAATAAASGRLLEAAGGNEPIELPSNYSPRLSRVGSPSAKAMFFEGARWYWAAIQGFDYTSDSWTSGLGGVPQGHFTSRGPFVDGARNSGEPYYRDEGFKPTEPQTSTTFRHGTTMNMALMDGSARSLRDPEVIDPSWFVPSGTRITDPTRLWWNRMNPDDPFAPGDEVY